MRAVATAAAVLSIAISMAAIAAAQPRGAQSARAAEMVRMGQAHLAAGDRASAIAYFRDAVAADPRMGPAYAGLGAAYRARGSLLDSRAALEAGLRRAPDHPPIYLELAATLLELSQPGEASGALRALLERDPRNVEALTRMADLARRRGAWGEALAIERRLIALAGEGLVSEERAAGAARYEQALGLLATPLDPTRSRCAASAVRAALCAR